MTGEANPENYRRGLLSVDFPETDFPQLTKLHEGKVRDIYRIPGNKLLLIATDRLSSHDRAICTVPNKGRVLTLTSAFWFEEFGQEIPSHFIGVIHPNVTVVEEADYVVPVEVVLRRYMAESNTKTSVWRNYKDGRRVIYGRKFPDGLQPNQRFPFKRPVFTPTSKGEQDLELTNDQARN